MAKFCESKTIKNLAACFAGEAQCGAKFQFIRKECMAQNFQALAKVMQRLATEEMGHAKRIFDIIVEKGDGEDVIKNGLNLEGLGNVAITASYGFKTGNLLEMIRLRAYEEGHQGDVVFKTFAEEAAKEGYSDVAEFFQLLSVAEKQHSDELKQIYELMKSGKLYKRGQPVSWKCINCGHIEPGKTAMKNCRLCNLTQGYVDICLCE